MNITYNWYTNSNYSSDFIYDESKISFSETAATLSSSGAQIDVPYIINNEGIHYSLLSKFTSTIDGTTTGGQVKFQISNDAEKWYFYNTSEEEWAENTFTGTDIISGSNVASELTSSVFENFVYQVDAGKLYWKALFFANGETLPSLSQVGFTGSQYYTTIKQVRDLLEPFGLRNYDANTGQYVDGEDFLSDSRLKTMISLADSYINNQTFTDFYYHRDTIEFYDGNGKDGIRTYNFPITKITHVVMYNPLMSSMRTFMDFELIIHPEWGEIFLPPVYPAFLSDTPSRAIFGNIFLPGKRNIEVMYDWGYSEPPDDINLAAKKYVGTQVLNAYWAWITRGVQSRSFDGYSESYMSKPFVGLLDSWDKEIKQTIANRVKVFPRSI